MQRIMDLRFVIGLFLSLIGLILILAHLSVGGEVDGIQLNLLSGLLFIVVGGGMLCLSIFTADPAEEPNPQNP